MYYRVHNADGRSVSQGEFPAIETSGTSLFVYGMAWGVNNGLLAAADYR